MVSRAICTHTDCKLIQLLQAPSRQPPLRSVVRPKSILKSTAPAAASKPSAKQDLLFPSSKEDKRRIKHAQFINKVTKSADRRPRRRRPNKKLVTSLDALADALPDHHETEVTATGKDGVVAAGEFQNQINIIPRKSMKSRPGAMKRRENVDKGERQRFVKNMAQLAAAPQSSSSTANPSTSPQAAPNASAMPSTGEKWAALRGFISQTLETKPELRSVKT
jgi:hypothetical protein